MEKKLEALETPEAKPETVKPHASINWCGVLKGAAIITAVVVAGVVGFWAINAAATSLLAVPQVSAAAQAVVSFTAPVVDFVASSAA